MGYALKSGTNYVYHYNLADHLGNVRATLKRGSTATAVDVTQRDNYNPFGKLKVVAGGNNKYLYNGKESRKGIMKAIEKNKLLLNNCRASLEVSMIIRSLIFLLRHS